MVHLSYIGQLDQGVQILGVQISCDTVNMHTIQYQMGALISPLVGRELFHMRIFPIRVCHSSIHQICWRNSAHRQLDTQRQQVKEATVHRSWEQLPIPPAAAQDLRASAAPSPPQLVQFSAATVGLSGEIPSMQHSNLTLRNSMVIISYYLQFAGDKLHTIHIAVHIQSMKLQHPNLSPHIAAVTRNITQTLCRYPLLPFGVLQ